MSDQAEAHRRGLRAARELAHVATSLAAEAANLSRAFEVHGALDASIVASQASIRAAQAAFDADGHARTAAPSLDELLLLSDSALDAASVAVDAARRAVSRARSARAAAGEAGAH